VPNYSSTVFYRAQGSTESMGTRRHWQGALSLWKGKKWYPNKIPYKCFNKCPYTHSKWLWHSQHGV